jgi:hypothetical protein
MKKPKYLVKSLEDIKQDLDEGEKFYKSELYKDKYLDSTLPTQRCSNCITLIHPYDIIYLIEESNTVWWWWPVGRFCNESCMNVWIFQHV